MRKHEAVIGLVASMFGCTVYASVPEQSDGSKAAVSRLEAPAVLPSNPETVVTQRDDWALRSMVSDMAVAWKARDARAYADQFTADAEHINAYGMWWRGRGEIEQAIRVALERVYPDNPISVDEITVRMVARRVAVVQYRWQLLPYTDPDGTKYDKPHGRVTQVVAQRQEGWRITNFQSTFINPNVPQPR